MAAVILQAQPRTGEIRLEVKDPSGAAVEASVKIQNPAAGMDRSLETDAQGRHTFESLPYGRYRLDVSKSGFATQSVSIDVHAAAPISRTVTLTLARAPNSTVTVFGATPLPGVDLPLEEMPAPVQTATQADMGKSGSLDLSDFMNRRLNGVYVNEMQGKPFQPDVYYRGYR